MWSVVFLVSISQGMFFLVLLSISGKYRTRATLYLCLLMVLFVITNLDYYVIAAELYWSIPGLFGISNGLMLLMGPLLYLYARSLMDHRPHSWRDLVHAIPYIVFFFISLPVYLLPAGDKIGFIRQFIAGNIYLRTVDYWIFSLQVIHFGLYMIAVRRFYRGIVNKSAWVTGVAVLLVSYGIVVAGLVGVVFVTGRYSVVANYIYTITSSLILYLVTGYALLNPGVAFETFRRQRKPLDNMAVGEYWEKLIRLMETDKVFTRSELKLGDLAGMVGLTSHQLSQLINQQTGRSFSDFVNHYRVEEFKQRIAKGDDERFTLVGLALEIGFNSKTAFNSTFKKITGTTPSEYRKSAGN